MEVLSYEMKERRTSKGEFLEVNMQLRMKRGKTDKLRVIDYMDKFNDVTMSAVEGWWASSLVVTVIFFPLSIFA